MRYVIEDGRRYVIRQGVQVEVISEPEVPNRPRRQAFKAEFVQVPLRWVEALQQTPHGCTYRLALTILAEAFKCKQLGGEVVLSFAVTGMPQTSRRRASMELQKLGLIRIERQSEKQAPIVYAIY
jgi:hypothetical protein